MTSQNGRIELQKLSLLAIQVIDVWNVCCINAANADVAGGRV